MPFVIILIAFYFLRMVAWVLNKLYGLSSLSDYQRWAGNPAPKVRRPPRRY